jgi:SAM-dependent methyltransferase
VEEKEQPSENSDKYLEINKKAWNARVESHVNSSFYDVPNFIAGKCSLNSIELDLLGDITGKRVLHLQCHFGQDSISLSRRGAIVTGVDFSDQSIAYAKELAVKTDQQVTFICSDIYSLDTHLNEQFDCVFISYGTIGWLPDLERWGEVISRFLRPDGQLVFVEFHPVVWMFDDDFNSVAYSYFNVEPIVEEIEGTYADRSAKETFASITWNHSLQEVMTSLIQNGLRIDKFQEFDYSPYNCFRHTEEIEPGKYRIEHLQSHIPMVYAISATKSKQ